MISDVKILEQIASRTALAGQSVAWFAPSREAALSAWDLLVRSNPMDIGNRSKQSMAIHFTGNGVIQIWHPEHKSPSGQVYDLVIVEKGHLLSGIKWIWETAIAPTLLDRNGHLIISCDLTRLLDKKYWQSQPNVVLVHVLDI